MKTVTWMRLLSWMLIIALLAGMVTPTAALSIHLPPATSDKSLQTNATLIAPGTIGGYVEPVVTATIGSEGGEFFSADGRLQITVPAQAVAEPAIFSLQRQTGEAWQRYVFSLQAELANSSILAVQLLQPLRISYALSDCSRNDGCTQTLRQQQPDETWRLLPSEQQEGVLNAQIATFGVFAVTAEGGNDTGTLLTTVLGAAPDLWTGSSSFSYPINMPAGPGGFAPSLNLSYSSEAANSVVMHSGTDYNTQADPIGYGWSLNVPSISSSGPTWNERRYTLSLGGKSYELINDNGWRTKPESFLRISRGSNTGFYAYSDFQVTCGGPVNIPLHTYDAAFWVIETPDGMRYQFGAYEGTNHDINDDLDATSYFRAGQAGNSGCNSDAKWLKVANRWGLVTATDSNGNSYSVNWDAETREIDDPSPAVSGYACGGQLIFDVKIEQTKYVHSLTPTGIQYGNTSIEFEYETRSDKPGIEPLICSNQIQYSEKKLSALTIKRNGTLVWRYDLVNTVPEGRRHLELSEIILQGAGSVALPISYTFTYDQLKNDNSNAVFLKQVDNGYTGKVQFSYVEKTIDDTPDPFCRNDNKRWVIATRTVNDGAGHVTTTAVEYPAHGQVYHQCPDKDFEFLGFSPVTETVYAVGQSSGTAERITVNTYHQLQSDETVDLRKGKLYQQTIGDGSTTTQITAWTWTTDGNWLRLDEVITTLDGVAQKTAYAYDSYGNTSYVREYVPTASGLSLYRTTWTEYGALVDSSHYLVDRPKQRRVYAGDVNGTCQQKTEYDYGGGYTADPVWPGNLLKERSLINNCTSSNDAQETRYGYANGNGSGGVNGNVTSVVQENGAIDVETRTNYYAPGIDIESVTQENGNNDITTSTTYDAYGRPDTITQPSGVQLRTRYDPFGRVCKTERKVANSASTWITQSLLAYSDTDSVAGAACTDLTFLAGAGGNFFGIMQKQVNDSPLGQNDPVPGGLTSFTFYDGLGRSVAAMQERNHSNAWSVSHKQYDALSQVELEVLPYGSTLWTGNAPPAGVDTVITTHDPLSRPLLTILPDGNQSSIGYYKDSAGLRRTHLRTDANGHRSVQVYDVLGNLVEVDERSGAASPYTAYAETLYFYDVLGQLTDVWDDANNHTSISYDRLGRKKQMSDPDMGTWYYKYDLAGNLLTQSDPEGRATCTFYDQLKRPTNKKFVTGITPATYTCPGSFAAYDADYSYDTCTYGLGQRCAASNSEVSITYSYNNRGLLAQETKNGLNGLSGSYQANYVYDALDRMNGIQYPDYDTTVWSYDASGKPYSFTGAGEVLVNSSTYTPWGALDQQQVGNGLTLDNDYSSQRRWLAQHRVGITGSDGVMNQVLLDFDYGYDAVGNVATWDDSIAGEAHSYTYDHLDRLTDWRMNTVLQQHYAYNTIGNIMAFAGVTYAYNVVQPHAVDSTTGGGAFSYDTAGYMESRRDATGAAIWTYTWGGNHKLAAINSDLSDTVTEFGYGPDDERIRSSSGPAGDAYTIYTLFPFYQVEKGCFRADVDCDGDVDVLDVQQVASRWNTPYAQFEQNGVAPITAVDVTLVAEKWLWEGATSSGQVVKSYSLGGRPIAVQRGAELTYMFQDHLGSPVLETDANAVVVARWKYEPYGSAKPPEGPKGRSGQCAGLSGPYQSTEVSPAK